MTDIRLKLSPPWITYINKVQALFDGDPQIACNVELSALNPSIVLSCNNGDKVTAIKKLLPSEVQFGNITLKVSIDGPESNLAFTSTRQLFETAFKGNPAFAYCVAPTEEGYWYANFTYVVFKNCVVQFFNDNLNDAHGIISTLYQDIAAELFERFIPIGGGVAYCTDIEDGVSFKADVESKLGKPLGEWP